MSFYYLHTNIYAKWFNFYIILLENIANKKLNKETIFARAPQYVDWIYYIALKFKLLFVLCILNLSDLQ